MPLLNRENILTMSAARIIRDDDGYIEHFVYEEIKVARIRANPDHGYQREFIDSLKTLNNVHVSG